MKIGYGISQRQKHLLGEHDQQSHTPKKYGAGTGNAASRFISDDAAYAKIGYSPSKADIRYAIANDLDYIWDEFVKTEANADLPLKASDNFNKFITDKPIAVRVPLGAIEQILEDGRLKTQFETGISKGTFSPEDREEAERLGLGYISENHKISNHPIYGYVKAEPTIRSGPNSNTAGYGSLELIFKEDIKNRTTIALGDTLEAFNESAMVGKPFWAKDKLGSMSHYAPYAVDGNFDYVLGMEYIEAQIHGGVKVSNIARVINHYPIRNYSPSTMDTWNRITRKLKSLNIEVVYEEEDFSIM